MKKDDCVNFLQWALPILQFRWPGFRKVRNQVCKRIDRRLKELDLSSVTAYQKYLKLRPFEWITLDRMCRISISRFYRDRGVFDTLRESVWPTLIQNSSKPYLQCWSVGCASGEEPYTLNIIWKLEQQRQYPDHAFHILATDADETMLQRAEVGCYPSSSLRDFPSEWREEAFYPTQTNEYCLRDPFKKGIEFEQQDIRVDFPPYSFDLILCRNLVFTYYETALQRDILAHLKLRLEKGGALIIGIHEHLPESESELRPWFDSVGIYRNPF